MDETLGKGIYHWNIAEQIGRSLSLVFFHTLLCFDPISFNLNYFLERKLVFSPWR